MSRLFTTVSTANFMTIGSATDIIGALCSGASGVSMHCTAMPLGFSVSAGYISAWMTGEIIGPMALLATAGGVVRVQTKSGVETGNSSAFGTTPIIPTKSYSIGGVCDFPGKTVALYINGNLDGFNGNATTYTHSTYSNTTAAAVLDQIGSAGATPLTSTTTLFSGFLSECAVWREALSPGEIRTLAKGAPALSVRRPSLVFYAPLIGRTSPEPDLINSNNCVINGTLAEGPATDLFVDPMITNVSILIAATASASSIRFRKTASRIGTRAGTRQTWNVT